MARIPQREVDRLKREVSLQRLVEAKGIELKKHGAQDLIGHCPFHDDRTPSFVVSPRKNLWHCLGACSTGGSVIDWVMRVEGVSFRHAVELLKSDAGLTLESSSLAASSSAPSPKLPAPVELEADDQRLLEQVMDYYHATLSKSAEARQYLSDRGLDHPELAETFRIGFSNRTLGYRIPKKRAAGGGTELRRRLMELGVYRKTGHEHFNGCVVVPITDASGCVVEAYGRKITRGLRKGLAHHLYLPGPHRGVFNWWGLQEGGDVILCESVLDAMTFWCAGFRNVTCSYGTSGFTGAHVSLFRELKLRRVLIAYDRDEAGNAASEKLGERLAGEGFGAFRVHFPKGMDANEYAQAMQPADKALDLVLRQASWLAGTPRVAVEADTDADADADADAEGVSAETRSKANTDSAADAPAEGVSAETRSQAKADLVPDTEAEAVSVETRSQAKAELALETKAEDVSAEMAAQAKAELVPDPEVEPVSAETSVPAPARADPTMEMGPVSAETPAPVGRIAPEPAHSRRPESPLPPTTPATSHPLAAERRPDPAELVSPPPGGDVPATPPVDMEQREHEVLLRFGDRQVRIRGLDKNKSYDVLKVNVFISRGARFFVDNLDLYHARQRAAFVKHAAQDLEVEEQTVKKDLAQTLRALEGLQDAAMQKAVEPKPEALAMSEAERAEALALLESPDLLEQVLADFEVLGVVGEETNKLAGYLAATSRKLERPLAVIVQSSSAAGKSSLMEAILTLVPDEERIKYSAMTGQSLYYLGETDLKHKVLAIVEEEGAERASYALKLLQSEGELTIASTGKDPQTGELRTRAYRVEGPVMIFLTTTALEVDEELLNRCLVLTVDEGARQTQAIHDTQRRSRTLEGLLSKARRRELIQKHQNAQRLLERMPVVNPYAEALTFSSHRTRTRRDHLKYLTLIESVALLHQHQRPKKAARAGSTTVQYIEVTPRDIEVANRLAHQLLGRTVDELPPQTRRVLEGVLEMVQQACAAEAVDVADYRFSRRQVREALGVSDTRLRAHLRRLVELEYLIVHRGHRGLSFVYELAYNPKAPGDAFLPGLIDADALTAPTSPTREATSPTQPATSPTREATSPDRIPRESANGGSTPGGAATSPGRETRPARPNPAPNRRNGAQGAESQVYAPPKNSHAVVP